MKMRTLIITTLAPLALVACGGQESDTSSITIEPSMTKVGKLGDVDLTNTQKFGYNNNSTADWQQRYAACAAAAGIKGEVQLTLKDYGTATTIDMVQTSNVSDLQRAQAFGCMQRFAEEN